MTYLKKLFSSEQRGQALPEYGLILVMASIVAIVGLSQLGVVTNGIYEDVLCNVEGDPSCTGLAAVLVPNAGSGGSYSGSSSSTGGTSGSTGGTSGSTGGTSGSTGGTSGSTGGTSGSTGGTSGSTGGTSGGSSLDGSSSAGNGTETTTCTTSETVNISCQNGNMYIYLYNTCGGDAVSFSAGLANGGQQIAIEANGLNTQMNNQQYSAYQGVYNNSSYCTGNSINANVNWVITYTDGNGQQQTINASAAAQTTDTGNTGGTTGNGNSGNNGNAGGKKK